MLLDNGVLQATFYNTSVAGLRKWAKAVGKQFNYPIESIYMQWHEDGSITAQFEPKLGTPIVPDNGKLWFVDCKEKRIINVHFIAVMKDRKAGWVKVSL